MRTISYSQISTYEDCNRFWWLTRILRLQEPPAAHFTFGTVLHAVAERWLWATPQGRVPSPKDVEDERGKIPQFDAVNLVWMKGPHAGQTAGDAVDLYPEGWQTVTERDGSTATVTPTEAKLIQRLIDEGIEHGILFRSPGLRVERRFDLKLGDDVKIMGFIDVFRPARAGSPPMIEDHKSYGKGSIRYLQQDSPESPNYVGRNKQLVTYATITSRLDEWGGEVDVAHNQFPKFRGRDVTRVSGTVTAEEQEEHWEYLLRISDEMMRTSKVKRWEDVPGPKDTGKCSHWYGKPCPFFEICANQETTAAYKSRMEKMLARAEGRQRLNLPLPQPRKRKRTNTEATMSIFDRAKKQKAARGARKDKAKAPETAKTPPVNAPTEQSEAAPVTGGAPWANPKCPACKGRGMNSKGRACLACDAKAKKEGRPTSGAYVVQVDDDGLGIAAVRDDHAEAVEAAGYPSEWIEAEGSSQEAAQEPLDEPEAEAAPEPDPEPEPETAQEAPPEAPATPAPRPKARKAKKGGRPTVGLTVLIGAVQLRGTQRPTIMAQEALRRFGGELAEDMKADSYWTLDPFKRRERLAQKAEYIAAQLARHIMIVPATSDPDVAALVSALIGLDEGIEQVVEGVR